MKSRLITQRVLLPIATALSMALAASVQAGTAEAKKYFDEAQKKLRFGDPGKAELLYAQAMQEAPNDATYAMALADLYITQHRFDSAAALINAGIKNNASDYRVWKTQGLYEQAHGNQSAAIANFEKAFSLGGQDDPYVLTNLQQHYEANGNVARRKQMESHQQPVSRKNTRKEYIGPLRAN